jgi:hypothetical protein
MKSNQLNAIALLLLATAGLSAENTGWLQSARDYANSSMTTVKGYMPEVSWKNAGIGALVVAVPAAAYKAYKRFFENEAVVLASSDNSDYEKIVNAKGYNKDAFTVVMSNKNARKRNTLIKDARINIDNACYQTGYKLQYALRKCYYNPVKTAAAILGLAGAGYMVHHYGLDTKAYSKLPSKPAWFGMPVFISNLFAKKTVETPKEEKQHQQPVEPAVEAPVEPAIEAPQVEENKQPVVATPKENKQPVVATPKVESTQQPAEASKGTFNEQLTNAADFIKNEIQTAKEELKKSTTQLKENILGPKTKPDRSGKEMGF